MKDRAIKKLSWYINRLSKMPPPEILYRMAYKFAERRDKARYLKEPPSAPKAVMSLISPKLFELCAVSRAELNAVARGRLGADIAARADAILANRLNVFGINYDFGEKIDWHLDVKTGRRWPLHFWADVNIREGLTIGGPKFVWETNRFYGLYSLGLAWRLSGEEHYAAKIFSLLEDWLAANPYPLGVNWTSGIELGIRTANLIWAISALAGRPFSKRETELVNYFVWLHGRHLYRYPSRYSSNNNHAVAEAFALFLTGLFFPYFKEASKWLGFGRQVLDREGRRQILKDGGSFEYTTTYLSFVFDFFLLYKLICDKNKIIYDPIINTRLEQSCEFVQALMDSGGNMPNIGDQDSAILIDFGIDNLTNFKSILNIGAILFAHSGLRPDDWPDFKTKILLADESCPVKVGGQEGGSHKPGHAGRHSISYRLLKESGLAVIRGMTGDKEFVFVGNATPLGMPPLYAHGHLDALSFTFSFAGLELLVDPGTYLYHSGGKWRRYFRSTVAHNTIRINETDMTEQVADFMFGRSYAITEHSLSWNHGEVIWQAGHDAYLNGAVPVSHVRRVVFKREGGEFAIIDYLDARGAYPLEQYFHFHPECLVTAAGSTVTIERGNIKMEMSCDRRLRLEIFKGSKTPILGWYSPTFNRLVESCSLVCKGEVTGAVELRTIVTILGQD